MTKNLKFKLTAEIGGTRYVVTDELKDALKRLKKVE